MIFNAIKHKTNEQRRVQASSAYWVGHGCRGMIGGVTWRFKESGPLNINIYQVLIILFNLRFFILFLLLQW